MSNNQYENGDQVQFKDEYNNVLAGTIYGVSKENDGSSLYHIVIEDTMYMVPEESLL